MTQQTEVQYKLVDGTSYYANTPDEAVKCLETSRQRKQRIRVFYGDLETGRDWMEEYDTIGHVGRSSGTIKIPLMIKNSSSLGGGSIVGSIVRITTKGDDGKHHDVYKHHNYHQGTFSVVKNPYPDKPEYVEGVQVNGELHAAFQKEGQAQRWIEFIKGNRNNK